MRRSHGRSSPSRSIAVAIARSPRTWSIASRYSGLARIERGDGLAPTNIVSSRCSFVAVRRGRVGQDTGLVDDQHGSRAEAAVADPGHAVRADRTGQRDRGQVVPASPCPPDVDGPDRAGRARQLDRGDQLAARERRDPGADEDLVDRDRSLAARTGDDHARPVDEEGRRCVGGRRRVADVPGEGGSVSDLHGPDDGRRLGERDVVTADAGVLGDVGHDGPRPDPEPAVVLADPGVELGDALDVDHGPRPDGPVAEPDDQVRAPGEEACLGPGVVEQRDGLADVRWAARRRTSAWARA